ncbi:hypothetical protein QA633_23155 [Bradyrhizobium barranii]|uniref:hypothetical protein n=1 Tax=Bradyrhizobium barranii TaxID=2992140 RepID=UPI0024AF1E90|nr:hypothetical protein [Bradyrhizobium barranii]WFT91273.1 hypothetical protein QA633_23155 [Bradyrhizobium barranii]
MAVLATSILFVPGARAQFPGDMVQCKFYTRTIPLEHETCVKLIGTSYDMHDYGVRVHLSHETLVNMCANDVAKKFPGKSLAEYLATCEDIFNLTF